MNDFYLKYLNLLLTKPIVQHPLLIALVAPAMLLSIPHSAKVCPLLPIDDNAIVDPLLDGIIATMREEIKKRLLIGMLNLQSL